MADRDNIIRMAREVGVNTSMRSIWPPTFKNSISFTLEELERLADLVIADFLQRTGQYLTNDASREAAIADAVAADREQGGVRAATLPPLPMRSPECWCETCDLAANAGFRSRMSLCPTCGYKRCPRATHHNNACTGSNAPGQKGSSWESVRPVTGEGGQHG